MAQKPQTRDERPLQFFSLKNFLAVNTTSSRIAIAPNSFYDLENAQPIGASNLHSVQGISAALHAYGADTIYYDADVNLAGTEFLIQASSTGKLFSFNVTSNAVAQINGATALSGVSTWITQWSNTTALIIDANGYFQWTGSGNMTSITGTGAPASGSAIAVYQDRAWIVQGRTLFWSAPASFSDFTTANGGGSITLIDPTLRSSVQALIAANGYLYVFGTTSIDSISDLYVPAGASPPTPVFTKLNLSAIVGTDQPYSIQMYGRLVLFANRYGAWSLYGTSVQRISGPDPGNTYDSHIDGTWQYLSFATPISGGQVISNNLLCAALLLTRLNDPVFGSDTVVGMYQGDSSGGKWWFANYGATGTITRISTAFINNAPALFAYIGNSIYQLFANAASAPAATISTALWDFGDPASEKLAIRAGLGIKTFTVGGGLASISLDTPNTSYPLALNATVGFVTWVNASGTIVGWVNGTSAAVQWEHTSGYYTYWGQAQQGFAKFIGITVTTNAGMVFELDAIMVDYKFAARYVGN